MLQLLFRTLESKRASFEQARQCGDLAQEIPIEPESNLLICGNGIFSYADDESLHRLIKSQLGGGRTRTR
ncbi:hypothetical protein [Helicobacter canis]|uniref:Uncharacterized protein n=1 Tax=Helicobacter canis NCTC 12740 TaxID=1357399 RepID=V8CKD7_9HELI|nr:hypothetical protein [Helicobacter canis]ETD27858.1 hypothetical protein HMPREF2087_00782 [Helicobacter canis NCTC 12740]